MRVIIIFAMAFVCTLPLSLFSQVQVNSIQTTVSTCSNNGTINVNATSPNPPLVYSIIAGPVTAPPQTNNIFNSLPSGTYTIKVTDGASSILTQDATIGGNYLQPDFDPLKRDPYCTGGSDGQLIGNVIAGTGTGPYTWQLIAPSPVTTAPQSSDTFNNLPAGNYTMRLTDACGGFRTVVATLADPPPTNISFINNPRITMIGCDTAVITIYAHADVERFPLSVVYGTNAGIITVPDALILDTINNNYGYFTIQQVLPNFTYSDVVSIMITDPCGITFSSPLYYAQPFYFCMNTFANFNDCQYSYGHLFDINTPECQWQYEMTTYANDPLTYQVTDAGGNVVASDVVHGFLDGYGYTLVSGFTLPQLPANATYTLTVQDACGTSFSQTFYSSAPQVLPPAIISKDIYKDACTDSACFCFIMVENFMSEPKLVFLSGPPGMGSTKTGYEYSATYNYPDTIPIGGIGPLNHRFDVSDLSAGTYQFMIFDTCGNTIYDSLVIAPTDVTDFGHYFWYKKGCLGQNELHYQVNASSGHMEIHNITNGSVYYEDYWTNDFSHPISDSLLNLPSGTYVLNFQYWRYFGSYTPLSHTPITCQQLTDTVVIEGYQTPSIFANNYIQCQSAIHVEIIPDSNKGVPPYLYEIISGPQTFPVQSSNIFDLAAAGTYTVRIYDICGNGSTSEITVDPIAFPPVTTIPFNCNSTSISYPTSQYYTYEWVAANGTVYIGDTLTIDPITPADTGIYLIRKIVNINGCVDTFYTTYHVSLFNTTVQTISICNGSSVTVGTHTYNSTGIHTDTLLNVNNCDSIVVLNLTVELFKRDSITQSICSGQSYTVGSHTYTQTGIYHDTLSTATCDSIVILQLTVNSAIINSITQSICSGQSYTVGSHTYTQTGIYHDTLSTSTCDSIVILNLTVNPSITNSITQSICSGQSYTVGSHTYTQTGIYHDTLSTSTCDSIVILDLTVNPLITNSITQSICSGDSYTVGNHTYTQTGIYHDTLSTSTCDSIVILDLTVNPFITNSITQFICSGESYTVGSHTYTQTGIYHDTLSTATCDSIVILHLTVNPLITNSITQSICSGESYTVGNHTYTQTGIYHDTLSTATCDSIVILHLTVNPLITNSITQSICSGESYTVGSHTYTQTGIYHDTLSTATCDSIVILHLTVNPLITNSITQSICSGESYTVGSHTYTQTGIYHDTLSTATCDSIVILHLTVNPLITNSITQSICSGASYTVGSHVYTQTGIYVDTLHTSGCDSIVTLNLSVIPFSLVQISASAYTVIPGDVIQLNATTTSSYLWTSTPGAVITNTTIQNPTATINNSSWIYLNTNGGLCTFGDSIYIRINKDSTICSGAYIYMPSAFTPNQDGLNDVFRILGNKIQLSSFQVYNRWGERVFQTNDLTKGWNGFYKGKLIAGSYTYMVSYYVACDPKARIMKGNILLIR